jgi:hypothetical protein
VLPTEKYRYFCLGIVNLVICTQSDRGIENMATYEICGTCSIHYDGATKIRLFPAEGFLSPAKDRAVLYPAGMDSGTCETAFLRTLDFDAKNKISRWLVFDEAPQTDILPTLQLSAATQRKIKLIVEADNKKLKVIQCIFPAP